MPAAVNDHLSQSSAFAWLQPPVPEVMRAVRPFSSPAITSATSGFSASFVLKFFQIHFPIENDLIFHTTIIKRYPFYPYSSLSPVCSHSPSVFVQSGHLIVLPFIHLLVPFTRIPLLFKLISTFSSGLLIELRFMIFQVAITDTGAEYLHAILPD